MYERPRARLVAYGVAVLCPAVSLVVRWPLWPVLEDHLPHMTFLPAVALAAYYGGLRPGLLATLLSALAAIYFLLTTETSLQIWEARVAVGFCLFVLTGAIFSGLSESLHRARERILTDERKRAEQVLRESEERFRQLAENVHEIFWVIDARLDRLTYVSPAFEEVSGRPRQCLYNHPRPFAECTHPDDREAAAAHEQRARQGVPTSWEFRLVRPDGAVRWLRNRAFPTRNEHGELLHISGLAEDVTERKQAEQALRDSEHRFRTFVDHATDAFYLQDDEGVILDVNRQACESLGCGRDELVGQTPSAFDPDFTPALREKLKRQLDAGETVTFESRHRRKDGSAFPVEVRGRAFWQAGRRFLVSTARDATLQKRAEEELRSAHTRLDLAVRGSNVSVWDVDLPDGSVETNRVTFVNFWEQLGHDGRASPPSFEGSLDLIHPDDRERIRRATRDYLTGETAEYAQEFRVAHRDGSDRWLLARGTALRDAAGRPTRFAGVRTDVTDLKRTQEALAESECRWRCLAEALPQLVWSALPDGTCDYFSTQWTQHTGVAQADLLGWKWLELLYPDDREPTRRSWLGSLAGLTPYDVEYRVRRCDGEYRWFKTRGLPLRDAEGAITKWFGTCTDVTDSKRQEAELRRAMQAAEAANHAKDEFLANVSHEIRTPMNAILGMTEVTLDTPVTEYQRQCLTTVKSAADNLLGMINDLLDFAKIEAGKMELDVAEFSLREALGDTLRALAVRAHKKGLELVSHVDDAVPDALVGDAGRLRQVLLNLVGNAIKFTPAGEVVVTVGTQNEEGRRQTERQGQASGDSSSPILPSDFCLLHFSVKDTGIGIPEDKHARIFRAFEQEDTSTTRKYGGSGLGLTIASRLVALMGGTIAVDSEPGKGSTFSFTASFGCQPSAPRPAACLPAFLRGLRVLVVDDNATNRHILRRWLRGWQMQEEEAGDGLTALDALWHGAANGRPFDLVLLDGRMPDTDGLALAARIRERAELAHTRLVLLTSGDRPGDLSRSRALRVDAHLLKPVQQEELLEVIGRAVSRAEEDRAAWPDEPEETGAAPQAGGLRVLVAEDNEFNAQLMEQLLARRGHAVRVAGDGREALALVESGGFDLLLLDVHMPELDGFGVIQAVRRREQTTGGHLPVIALTARSRKEDRERCLAAGMDAYLSKPVVAADLWAAIDRVAPAAPADRPSAGLLDARVLLASCGGDDAILGKISEAFRTRLPGQVAAVRGALRSGDAAELREAAHKLSGIVAAFSSSAGAVASDLEDRAAAGRLAECGPLVERLEGMARELIEQAGGLSIEGLRQRTGSAKKQVDGNG